MHFWVGGSNSRGITCEKKDQLLVNRNIPICAKSPSYVQKNTLEKVKRSLPPFWFLTLLTACCQKHTFSCSSKVHKVFCKRSATVSSPSCYQWLGSIASLWRVHSDTIACWARKFLRQMDRWAVCVFIFFNYGLEGFSFFSRLQWRPIFLLKAMRVRV